MNMKLLTPYDLEPTDPKVGAILLVQRPATVTLLHDGFVGVISDPTEPFTAIRLLGREVAHDAPTVLAGPLINMGSGGIELLPVEPPLCRLTPGTPYRHKGSRLFPETFDFEIVPNDDPYLVTLGNSGLSLTLAEFAEHLEHDEIVPIYPTDEAVVLLGKNMGRCYPYLALADFDNAELMLRVISYYTLRYDIPVIRPPVSLLATLAALTSPTTR